MALGEQEPEYGLRRAVAVSRPLSDEVAGVSGYVLSVMQRPERELPRGADEFTRELLDATRDVYRTSGSRTDLEERAHHAVTIADLVLLCFDTQNQQDGEFRKVAEWVTAYGKPALLWQWSTVPALESLIVQAIRRNAEDPWLGRLVQQVQGTLTAVDERHAIDTAMVKLRL